MTSAALIADAFERIREEVHQAVEGLSADDLVYQLDDRANSIAWLVWHLTRVQDDHVAKAAGAAQVWTSSELSAMFGFPLDDEDTGYGHSTEQVRAVRATAELLLAYHDAVCEQTIEWVRHLTDSDLDRIVDERFDPPVTLGVRLVSVIADDLEHAGQAAYVRGILERL